MKRLIALVVVVAFCSSAWAAPGCECAAYGVSLEAFSSPFDQHQELDRLALELGAENVQDVVAPKTDADLPRYLIFVRACDAYVCFVNPARVVMPPSALYELGVFERSADAFAEYAQHGDAAARGVITMGDASIVVYWSSTRAAAVR
jgi:hypothetical protein